MILALVVCTAVESDGNLGEGMVKKVKCLWFGYDANR